MVTFLFAVEIITEAKPGHLTWCSAATVSVMDSKSEHSKQGLVEFLVFLLQIILCLI